MALERSGACFPCTVSNLGAPLAKTVIKAHILTGDDCMSKVGTKHAAMASDPVQYLTNVGEVDTLSDQDSTGREVLSTCLGSSGARRGGAMGGLTVRGENKTVDMREIITEYKQTTKTRQRWHIWNKTAALSSFGWSNYWSND